jgi:hypothetical protein
MKSLVDVCFRNQNIALWYIFSDRLCGLVVRLPGCKLGGPEFDSLRYHF